MILNDRGIDATPDNFLIAEQGLLAQTQANSAFWSGRAATGLYYAYQLAKQNHPQITQAEVIVPAMMCATAANTALIAGIQPRFADVGADTGLMTLETIKARYTENTVAVVVIHLLGHMVDIDPIAEWCKAHDLLLIEDPTHALSGQYPDGRYAGSVGDIAMFSFNPTKIIDKGNGVLTAKTQATADTLKALMSEPIFPDVDDNIRLQLALSYRNLHHSLVGLLRLDTVPSQDISTSFNAVRSAYNPLYLRPAKSHVELNSAWENLPQSLAHRLKLANIYAENLQHESLHLLTDFQSSGVCWRFSLLIDNPTQQVAFSEAIRKDGFHVSNLYWATNQFFKPDDVCEGANSFSRRIVNLWVDASVDEDYVKRCCESVLKYVEILAE